MLNRVAWQTSTRAGDPQVAPREEPIIDLIEVFSALRRRGALIAGIVSLAICGAVIYVATTPPRYTASSMLLFDVRKIEPFQQQGYQNAAADSAFVDSQVEVLKSENIAKSVVRNLNLLSDPEFAPSEAGLLASIHGVIQGIVKAVLGAGAVSVESDQFGRVVRIFRKNLTIKRIGLTYVISIDYQSLDPNKAASISNAVAEAYIVSELNSKYQAGRRANVWLQGRISELKTLAQSTERAVAEYKAKNNVIDAGPTPLNEQQLAELSTERRVVLQDLESSAQTYRTLHEALLQRIAEFTQQQSFPATEARVVSPASPPLEKSGPKPLLALGVASLLGLVGALGGAFVREYLDSGVRTPRQVEKKVGIDCLGMLPTINPAPAAPEIRHRWWKIKRHQDRGDSLADRMTIVDLHDQHNSRRQTPGAKGDRIISPAVGRYRFVLDRPFSYFAETIRSLKVAVEIAGSAGHNKVIGVTSARPREGKSLVAANLSEMLAISGSRTLLIDGDPRHLGLTRRLAPKANMGLLQAVAGRTVIEDLVWRDPDIYLEFLPMVPPAWANHPVWTASSAAMQKLLEAVQQRYDYIIVDLPPITPVADVKAVSHLIDHFILVIEWGRTSHEAVIDALKTAPLVLEKLLGAVLNKADPTAVKSYKGDPDYKYYSS
jgi:capsular exopolysaccharide synthesis family protein